MVKLWQQIAKGEKGQALPIVLILLLVGVTLIAPTLDYASTNLNAGRAVKQNVRGVYAADAAVEHVLWCLRNSQEPSEQLPESVNQMQVAIETENRGTYTMAYQSMMVEVSESEHFGWLTVDGEITWVGPAQAYKYTITVTRQPDADGNIKLDEVGVRLPLGYSYEPGSAAGFEDNLSADEPEDTLDGAGAHMLNWEFPTPLPVVTEAVPEAVQEFYITGEGDQVGDYAWVVAARDDVGTVGEFTGTLYRITATATRPEGGEVTAQLMADAILDEETAETRIIYWQEKPA